ncbi:MAG TPA: hypothetical protein VIL07_01620, partial [Symbiobacteriaceae bacterium]
MNLRRIIVAILLFSLGLGGKVEADGWGFFGGHIYDVVDTLVCDPPVPSEIAARLYSYRVPFMITNEARAGEVVWAYAEGCVKAPSNWQRSEYVPRYVREGKTWSSLSIRQNDNQTGLWRATFPPVEEARVYPGDDFSPFGPSKIYVPSFGLDHEAVSLVEAPNRVLIGVSRSMAETLREAGMIVEKGQVWVEYSSDPIARKSRNLKPLKAIHRWAPAYYLLCDPETHQKRTGNNADLARTLMVRNPAFSWELAKDFDCRSSSDKDESGLRKWGGGIVVLHLFPNLELAPLEVTAQD